MKNQVVFNRRVKRSGLYLFALCCGLFAATQPEGDATAGAVDFKGPMEKLFTESGISKTYDGLNGLVKGAKAYRQGFEGLSSAVLGEAPKNVGPMIDAMNKVVQALGPARDKAGAKVAGFMSSVGSKLPDGSFSIDVSAGKMVLDKKGERFKLLFNAAPTGGSVLVGFTNASPALALSSAGPIENASKQPLLFAEVALGSSTIIQAYVPIAKGLPKVVGKSYVTLDGKSYEIAMSFADPKRTEVKGSLSFEFKGSVDDVISVGAGVSAEISYSVSAKDAVRLTSGLLAAIKDATRQQQVGEGGMTAEQTEILIKAVLNNLAAQAKEGMEMGEVELGVKTGADAGVGVWDTKLSLGKAEAGIGVSLPVNTLINVANASLAPLLRELKKLASYMQEVGVGFMINSEVPQHRFRLLVDSSNTAAVSAAGIMRRAIGDALSKSDVVISFQTSEMGGGDASCNILNAELEIPGANFEPSKFAGAVLAGLKVSATVMRALAPNLPEPPKMRASSKTEESALAEKVRVEESKMPPTATNDTFGPVLEMKEVIEALKQLGSEAMLKVSVAPVPVMPIVNVTAEMPVEPVINLLSKSDTVLLALFKGLRDSAGKRGFSPLAEGFKSGLAGLASGSSAELRELRENLKLGMSLGGGLQPEIGAEVTGELGFGAKLMVLANPELLVLLGQPKYDNGKTDGEATIVAHVVGSASGGASIGEGVEVGAKAGGESSQDALFFSIREWDKPIPASMQRTVAGFPLIAFDGQVGADGSLNGTGTLLLPTGGSVSATFQMDKTGHIASGTWSAGSLSAGKFSFTAISGTLTDSGLGWSKSYSFPVAGQISAEFKLNSAGTLTVSGSRSVKIAGVNRDFSIFADSKGNIYLKYEGTITIAGKTLTGSELTINNSGLTGKGSMSVLGQTAQFSLQADSSGNITGTASGTYSFYGKQVAMALGIDKNGLISASGSIVAKVAGTDQTFNISLDSNGNLQGKYNGSIAIGGRSISNVELTMSNTAITGKGKIAIAGVAQYFTLAVTSSGDVTGYYDGSVTLKGNTLTGRFSLAKSGAISIASSFSVPIGNTNLSFVASVDSSGGVTGRFQGATTLFGIPIKSADLTLTESNLSGSCVISLAGTDQTFQANLDANGAFKATYNGSLNFGGRQLSGVSLTLDNTGLNGGGDVTLAGSTVRFALTATAAGISGNFSGSLSAYGYSIASASLALTSAGSIDGSGNVTVAGSALSFTLHADTSGNLSGDYSGGITAGGWTLASGLLHLGTDGLKGSGSASLLGQSVSFTISVNTSGQLTGSASSAVTLPGPVSGIKSVQLVCQSISLNADGSISGTGYVKANNINIANSTFTFSSSGTASGSGSITVGGKSITGSFSIGPSTFTLSGSTTASASAVGYTFSATVSVSVKDIVDVSASASGSVSGPGLSGVSMSGSMNLGNGEVTINLGRFLPTVTFDLM